MNRNRLYATLAAAFVLTGLSAVQLFAAEGYIENFSPNKKDVKTSYPENWALDGTKIGVNPTKFEVQSDPSCSENGKLVVTCNKATGALMTDLTKKVDLNKTPIMRWRWRIVQLPEGADGRPGGKDDQGIALYIGANGFLTKNSIAYRWETKTPVGYVGTAKYGGGLVKVHFFAIRNEDSPIGKWVMEERNVAADFEKAYGKVPKEFALSVCANSQYTGTQTKAEVDYIQFLSKAEAKKDPLPSEGSESPSEP